MPSPEILQYHGIDSTAKKLRYTLVQLWRFSLSRLAFFVPFKGWRATMYRWSGVRIGRRVYIGHDMLFDRAFPEQITIGDDTAIGDRCTITAHGCIPTQTPLKEVYPLTVKPVNIGVRPRFADIAATICDIFEIPLETQGESFKEQIL